MFGIWNGKETYTESIFICGSVENNSTGLCLGLGDESMNIFEYDDYQSVCPRCNGTGQIICPLCQQQNSNVEESCIYCKGNGKVECPKCGGNAFIRSYEDNISSIFLYY